MRKSFHFGRRTGVPRQAGDIQVTPESLVLVAQIGSWGYVWNWPIAVTLARDPGGGLSASPRVERHAVVDITRIMLWSMRAITLLMLVIASVGPLFMRARKRKP
jgi:hypothetical protein